MLLIEKMETALETIRDVDIETTKEKMVERAAKLKSKVVDAIPFASETDFARLEKKVTTLNRKMTQLKKQLKELEV
jgi:hypothetical protein